MSDESEVVEGAEVSLGTGDAGAVLARDNFVTPSDKQSQHTPPAGSELEAQDETP